MSTVHPRAEAPSARIRILGCEPPPPPPRRLPWRLVIACVAAAALGVALAAGVRHLLRPAQPTGVAATPLGLQAGVNARAFPPSPVLARTLRASAPLPHLRAAARVERRERAALRRARKAEAPQQAAVQVPATSPTWQAGAPDTSTVPRPAPPVAPTRAAAPAPAAPASGDAVTRPDLPPDPTDPNAQIDGP